MSSYRIDLHRGRKVVLWFENALEMLRKGQRKSVWRIMITGGQSTSQSNSFLFYVQ